MAQTNPLGSFMMLGGQELGNFGMTSAVAEPARPAAGLSDEWKRWVAENVLLGKPTESIEAALIRSGFDRALAAAELRAAMSHPYVVAAQQLAGQGSGGGIGGIAPARLAKRDWILEMYRRSARQDPATAQVPVVHRPSREQFLHEFYSANRPVIIEGAMDEWPAMKLWTMDYLRE